MTTSWSDVAAQPGPPADELRAEAAAACPGRTALLVSLRIAQLLGAHDVVADLSSGDTSGVAEALADRSLLSSGEAALVDVVELFVADAHAITDDCMAAFTSAYPPDDAMGILIHLALSDGFTKRHLMVG